MDSLSLAYLDAMGIEVWQPRRASADEDTGSGTSEIVIGAGDGDILCIVESGSEASLRLAADIGGAMRCSPVWAWPSASAGQSGESLSVQAAVTEKMLTRILVFGGVLAARIFGPEIPTVISAARVHVVPGLAALKEDRSAKRILWGLMNENGIAAGRGNGS